MLSIHELKQIQLSRQHLTNKVDKHTACRDLNGFQAQFTVNVEHSLKIRCNEKIEKDNFGSGLVKNWTIRNTVHVFNEEDMPLYKYKNESNPYQSHDWGKATICAQRNCVIHPDRLEYIAKFIVDKVSNGITKREDIKKECYSAGITENEGAYIFDQWGGLLRPLCERGFLCYKVQEKKEFMICPTYIPMERDEALIEQAKRYLTHFAPATIRDMAYYFGWTQAFVKEIMQKLPILQTTVDGKNYYYLEELKDNYPDIPHCILLAGFDQLMLGYQKQDSIYLPQKYLRGIFNLAGIVMPPILLNGVVVGKWKKKNKKLLFELFENISNQDKEHIESVVVKTFDDIQKTEWKF